MRERERAERERSGGRLARKWRFLALCFSLSLVLTGCWDLQDIERRAMVLGMGIDGTPGAYQVTLQFPHPSAVATGGFGGSATQGGKGGAARPFVAMIQKAPTLATLDRLVEARTARRLYWGHIQNVVIGEQAAREGILPELDFLMRNAFVDRHMLVYLATDAASVYEMPLQQEQMAATYLRQINASNSLQSAGLDTPTYLWRIWAMIQNGTQDPVIPWIAPNPEQQTLDILQMGFFSDGRLAGFLRDDTAVAYGIASSSALYADVTFAVPKEEFGVAQVGLRVFRTSAHLALDNAGTAQRSGRLRVQLEAEVTEAPTLEGAARRQPDLYQRLTPYIERDVQRWVESMLQLTQKAHSDVLGFGQHERVASKDFSPGRWRQEFADMPIDVQVKAHITMTQALY